MTLNQTTADPHKELLCQYDFFFQFPRLVVKRTSTTRTTSLTSGRELTNIQRGRKFINNFNILYYYITVYNINDHVEQKIKSKRTISQCRVHCTQDCEIVKPKNVMAMVVYAGRRTRIKYAKNIILSVKENVEKFAFCILQGRTDIIIMRSLSSDS